ncbi:MAG: tRNA (adenosine(37)-N6)-threonylcarbamoyltransferase complex dimerization subunit type 1 TsaB, partial [Burkholderiales bacterium]
MTHPLPQTATAQPDDARFLAIETSTDRLSVALGSGRPGAPVWQRTGAGGAQASTDLLPDVRDLLAESGWTLASLDAIVFGRGPGAFTGLRTACAVAQGLAFGAGRPVLPVDTLLALAEQARGAQVDAGLPEPEVVVAMLDARMDEIYVAPYARQTGAWRALAPARLCAPEHLAAYLAPWWPASGGLLAGNVFAVYGDRLGALPGPRVAAWPDAQALLRLAPALLAAGAG